jgi:CheY-like chemotaxis protein
VTHTLLLADDSVTIQRVIELTFAEEDVQVVAVSDGDQAIERLEAAPPDIVLADVGMPGRDGYEVARYVRQSPRLAHIPVVLLTGAFEPVDEARAAEVGCDGVLAKPFEPQLVIGRVRELLASSAGRPSQTPEAAGKASEPGAHNAPWAPPALNQPFSPPDAQHEPADLDAYFDRLDSAFAALPGRARTPEPPPSPSIADFAVPASAPDSPSVADQIDWLATQQTTDSSAGADLPLSFASPQSAFDPPALPAHTASIPAPPPTPAAPAENVAPTPMVTPPAAPVPAAARVAAPHPAAGASPAPASSPETPALPRPPAAPAAAPRSLPSVADAFAAILAAEQDDDASEVRQGLPWPVPPSIATPAAPVPPTISDDVIEEVVRRVLERLSDQAVRESVAVIAERLVREEIERIRAAIK